MKQGCNPTRKQKALIKQRGLNPANWLITKNLSDEQDLKTGPPKRFIPLLQVNIKTGRIILDKLNTLDRGCGYRANKKS